MTLTKRCPRAGQPHCLGTISDTEPKRLRLRRFCSHKCSGQAHMRTRPLCGCGCGGHVRLLTHKFIAGHVPTSLRSEAGRKARKTAIFKSRRARYERVFSKLTEGGRSITKEGLLAAFYEVERHGYDVGWHANEAKWRGRTPFATIQQQPQQIAEVQ